MYILSHNAAILLIKKVERNALLFDTAVTTKYSSYTIER